jgi:hypothetical protein
MYMVLAFVGSVMIACTAPADVPLGGASPLWTVGASPKIGDGPCGRKVWARTGDARMAPTATLSRAR